MKETTSLSSIKRARLSKESQERKKHHQSNLRSEAATTFNHLTSQITSFITEKDKFGWMKETLATKTSKEIPLGKLLKETLLKPLEESQSLLLIKQMMMVNQRFALLNGESANALEPSFMELIKEMEHSINLRDGLRRLLIKKESLTAQTKTSETHYKEPKRTASAPTSLEMMKRKLNLSISVLISQIKSMD
jgi:hypothetical protein